MTFSKVKSQSKNNGVDMERVRVVAETLEGTCKNLSEVVTPDELEDSDFLEALDGEVLECPQCGWWSESSDFDEGPNGEDLCGDCRDG